MAQSQLESEPAPQTPRPIGRINPFLLLSVPPEESAEQPEEKASPSAPDPLLSPIDVIGINTSTLQLESARFPNVVALTAASAFPAITRRAVALDRLPILPPPPGHISLRLFDGDDFTLQGLDDESLQEKDVLVYRDGSEPELYFKLESLIAASARLQRSNHYTQTGQLKEVWTTWIPTAPTPDSATPQHVLLVFGAISENEAAQLPHLTAAQLENLVDRSGTIDASVNHLGAFTESLLKYLRQEASRQGLPLTPTPYTASPPGGSGFIGRLARFLHHHRQAEHPDSELIQLLEGSSAMNMSGEQIRALFQKLHHQLFPQTAPAASTQPETSPATRIVTVSQAHPPFEPGPDTSRITSQDGTAVVVRPIATGSLFSTLRDHVLTWNPNLEAYSSLLSLSPSDSPVTRVRRIGSSVVVWRGNGTHSIHSINPATYNWFIDPATFDRSSVSSSHFKDIRQLTDLVPLSNLNNRLLTAFLDSSRHLYLCPVSPDSHFRNFTVLNRPLSTDVDESARLIQLSPNRFGLTHKRGTLYLAIDTPEHTLHPSLEITNPDVNADLRLTGCTQTLDRLSVCPTHDNSLICFDTADAGQLHYAGAIDLSPHTSPLETYTCLLGDRLLAVTAPPAITRAPQIRIYDLDPKVLAALNGRTVGLDYVQRHDPLFRVSSLHESQLAPIHINQIISLTGLESAPRGQKSFLFTNRGDVLTLS